MLMDIQLSQHHFLTLLSPLNCLGSLAENQLTIKVRVKKYILNGNLKNEKFGYPEEVEPGWCKVFYFTFCVLILIPKVIHCHCRKNQYRNM